jgi:hypothetical protein
LVQLCGDPGIEVPALCANQENKGAKRFDFVCLVIAPGGNMNSKFGGKMTAAVRSLSATIGDSLSAIGWQHLLTIELSSTREVSTTESACRKQNVEKTMTLQLLTTVM